MRYKYITKIENKFDKKKTPEGLLSKKIKKCLSNSRIHNRFVFGMYSSITARLMYGFTQEVIDAIKKDWPGEK